MAAAIAARAATDKLRAYLPKGPSEGLASLNFAQMSVNANLVCVSALTAFRTDKSTGSPRHIAWGAVHRPRASAACLPSKAASSVLFDCFSRFFLRSKIARKASSSLRPKAARDLAASSRAVVTAAALQSSLKDRDAIVFKADAWRPAATCVRYKLEWHTNHFEVCVKGTTRRRRIGNICSNQDSDICSVNKFFVMRVLYKK